MTTPSYSLDISGNSYLGGDSIVTGNVGIGTLTPSYSLDVSGNGNFYGYLLNKPICFYSYTTTSVGYNVNQPISYSNKLIYQNLGGYSSSLYGFQTVAVGSIPAGAFIAPVTGIYTFYFRMRENDNNNLSDYFSVVNTNGTADIVVGQIFKLTDGQSHRGVDSSILILLNQGQGFYYAADWVGSAISFCYFGGKLEGTFS